ncbi:dephospho-CoA kinase [Hoeflea sp. CAU 1731]
MIVLGLTGSIGMGKTTIGDMFVDRGVPHISADEIVHKIYAGRAAPLIETAFPGSVIDGVVDRDVLSRFVLGNEAAMKRLEAIVHPLVHEEREKFVESARRDGARLVILDIPLLFETGGDASVDRVLVVTCDEAIQRERVLARPGMTVEKFESIKSRQTPDAEKRRRADYVIDTSGTFADSEQQVDQVLAQILAEGTNG